MKTLRILLLMAEVTVLFSSAAIGQVATGTPPFSSTTGGSFDTIDLGNLNVHIAIPIMNRAGRGTPFHYAWSYDSSIWYPSAGAWTPIANWGWRSETEAAVGYIYFGQSQTKCFDQPGGYYWATRYSGFAYYDKAGTHHPFAIQWTECVTDNRPHSGVATDGSGMFLNADTDTVTLTSGTVISAPANSNTGSGSVTDTNGNYITVTPTAITDTLGSTALSITGSPSPTKFSYTGPQSGTQNITIAYQPYNIKTNFGCSGISEYSSTNVSLATTITLPDTTKYTIAYEPTPGASGYYTGRIQSITLPTGGTLTYIYNTGSNNDGISCVDGSTVNLSKTTPDTGSNHPWQYSRTQSGNNWQTTITDPAGNQTVATFSGIYELQRMIYSGTATGGTLLKTIDTCYNATAPDGNGTCLSSTPVSPFTQVDTYNRLPSIAGVSSKTTTKYDSSYSRLIEADDYDFGALGNGVGSLIRQKTISYASLGNNIQNRPSQVTVCPAVCNGSNAAAQTTYSYDVGTPTATSGTPQHSSVSGSRGNVTQISSLVTAGTSLSKSFTYYDTGGVYTATDVNNAITTFTFSDSTHSCGNSFSTNVQLPLSLTRSMTWNCTGAVQTGLTDENGNSSSVTYNDPYYWRPTYSTDTAGNQTNYSYTTTTFESSMSFNGGHSVVDQLITLDSLGRPHVLPEEAGTLVLHLRFRRS